MNALKILIVEIIRSKSSITDKELVSELKKKGLVAGGKEINQALLHLEIQGLVNVRWASKDKRRIEFGNRTTKQPQTIW